MYLGKYPDVFGRAFLANPALDYEKCFLNPTTPWAREHFENIFERLGKEGYIKLGSRNFKVGRPLFEEMKLYNPCEELKKYNRPLLIVQGDQDDKIAYWDVVGCFNKLTNPQKKLKVIKGASHGFHTEPFETQVVEAIVKFFSE